MKSTVASILTLFFSFPLMGASNCNVCGYDKASVVQEVVKSKQARPNPASDVKKRFDAKDTKSVKATFNSFAELQDYFGSMKIKDINELEKATFEVRRCVEISYDEQRKQMCIESLYSQFMIDKNTNSLVLSPDSKESKYVICCGKSYLYGGYKESKQYVSVSPSEYSALITELDS